MENKVIVIGGQVFDGDPDGKAKSADRAAKEAIRLAEIRDATDARKVFPVDSSTPEEKARKIKERALKERAAEEARKNVI